MSDDCFGAKFEILLDGMTQSCRDTMLTAMGAATFIKSQNPNSKVAVRDLQTGQLTVSTTRVTGIGIGTAIVEAAGDPPPLKWSDLNYVF